MSAAPLIRAVSVAAEPGEVADTVVLDFDSRHRRRIALTGERGFEFVMDLPEAAALKDGDALALEDGRAVLVRAADEALMAVTAADAHQLTRLAWHIGNRHLNCEIHPDRLVLRWDHVIADMVEKLGGRVARFDGPFQPEGGAYGHGRTHSHQH